MGHKFDEQEEIDPPSAEQWSRLSEYQRWKIFFLVLREMIPYHLAEFGLWLGRACIISN